MSHSLITRRGALLTGAAAVAIAAVAALFAPGKVREQA